MEIAIRNALPADARNYAACHISCWQTAYAGIVPCGYLSGMAEDIAALTEKYIKNLSQPGGRRYFCVTHEQKMIGFVIINAVDGEIWAVYLLEQFRNRGFGAQMLAFAVDELKRANPADISLWVFEQNTKARRFYERHGFHFGGETREKTYGKPLVQLKYTLSHG